MLQGLENRDQDVVHDGIDRSIGIDGGHCKGALDRRELGRSVKVPCQSFGSGTLCKKPATGYSRLITKPWEAAAAPMKPSRIVE